MKIILDVIILVLIALCTWTGYKRGVVGGIAGMLAIAVGLFGGALLADAYSSELIPAFKPFISGYVDSQSNREDILADLGYAGSDRSLTDILEADPSLRYDYAYSCMKNVGFYEARADELAQKAVQRADMDGENIGDAVVQVQCETVMYVLCISIGFLLIVIILMAVGNMFNFSFRLPNMENLDEIGGAVIGFFKGMLLSILLAWVLSFLGILIGKTTISETVLTRFFLAFRFVTGGLL